FDNGGTLLGGGEEVGFAQAFQEHCGPAVDLSFSPGLLVSDSAYIHDVLTRSYGRPATAAENAALIARFVAALDALTASGETPVRVVAGVHAFVNALSARAPRAISTGCVEPSARVKLRRAGLDEAFPCGGYSRDERSRADIVRRAIAAAAQTYPLPLAREALLVD